MTLTLCHLWEPAVLEKLLEGRHEFQAVLSFLHPVGATGKAHPSLCISVCIQ